MVAHQHHHHRTTHPSSSSSGKHSRTYHADTATSCIHPPFSHIATTANNSWQIYSVLPRPTLVVTRPGPHPTAGPPARAVLLRDTNVVVVVCGERTVTVWDELAKGAVWTIDCAEDVCGVAALDGFVAIIHPTSADIYTLLPKPSLFRTIPTYLNPQGLHSHTATSITLPGAHRGQVSHTTQLSPGTSPSTTLISAHTAPISALATSHSATLVASASETGTLVRVWACKRGAPPTLLRELRRGVERATVWSLAFDEREQAVCVASNTLTVHIFTLAEPAASGGALPSGASDQQVSASSPSRAAVAPSPDSPDGKNRTSILEPLAPYIPLPKYFSSTWSFAHFRIPDDRSPHDRDAQATPCTAVFLSQQTARGDSAESGLGAASTGSSTSRQTIAVLRGLSLHLFEYDTRRGGEATSVAYYRIKTPAPVTGES
ncbi:hypothetical protein HDU89_007273 [Geranomyces variabilis]|nr:hypothetical protein HDU89_007273 [Geranomyces variabilis]